MITNSYLCASIFYSQTLGKERGNVMGLPANATQNGAIANKMVFFLVGKMGPKVGAILLAELKKTFLFLICKDGC
jgi:hypothetical protein